MMKSKTSPDPSYSNPVQEDQQRPRVSLVLGILGLCLVYAALIYFLSQHFSELAPGATEWWAAPKAGLWGGIGGSCLGIMGGVIGTLGGCGVARPFVLGLMRLMTVIGVILTVMGVVAIIGGQPRHVWYVGLHMGPLCAVLSLALYPLARRAYEQRELQKMRAMDS